MKLAGVGVDIQETGPFRKRSPARDKRFYDRLFSPEEIAYCRRHRDPAPHFAARFCAKEALVKAARKQVPVWVGDVEVRNDADGAPHFRLRSSRPDLRRFWARHEAFLSLSHTDDQALAFVVLVRKAARK